MWEHAVHCQCAQLFEEIAAGRCFAVTGRHTGINECQPQHCRRLCSDHRKKEASAAVPHHHVRIACEFITRSTDEGVRVTGPRCVSEIRNIGVVPARLEYVRDPAPRPRSDDRTMHEQEPHAASVTRDSSVSRREQVD